MGVNLLWTLLFFVITPTFDFTSHVMKIRVKTCQTVDD